MPPSVNMISPPVRFAGSPQMKKLAMPIPIARTAST
jgi:hypothetical protein